MLFSVILFYVIIAKQTNSYEMNNEPSSFKDYSRTDFAFQIVLACCVIHASFERKEKLIVANVVLIEVPTTYSNPEKKRRKY